MHAQPLHRDRLAEVPLGRHDLLAGLPSAIIALNSFQGPVHATLIARDHRILAGHAAGAMIPQLALAEEVDIQIGRVLGAAGIAPIDRRNSLPPSAAARLADSAWLAAEYATKSGAQIAEELGCTRLQVYEALRSAGIARRERSEYVPMAKGVEPWPAEVADQVVERYAAGESAPAIAEGLEVPAGRVYKLLRERGVLRSASEARKVDQGRRRAAAEQARPPVEAPAGKRDKEWAPELQTQVLERYAAGESGPAIADGAGAYAVAGVSPAARARGAAKDQ